MKTNLRPNFSTPALPLFALVATGALLCVGDGRAQVVIEGGPGVIQISDRDGKPDAWLQPNPYSCLPTDLTCNGLTLDEDDDNDGIPDSFDPAPLNPNAKWPLDGAYQGSAIREAVSP